MTLDIEWYCFCCGMLFHLGVPATHAFHVSCSMLMQIVHQMTHTIRPGFNVETVEYKNISFTVWDVGGQVSLQHQQLFVV